MVFLRSWRCGWLTVAPHPMSAKVWIPSWSEHSTPRCELPKDGRYLDFGFCSPGIFVAIADVLCRGRLTTPLHQTISASFVFNAALSWRGR
jgi:hypothetical protein